MSIKAGKNIPILGLDLDSDQLRIKQNKARYLKNLLFNSNRNTESGSGEGENFGVLTPLESNSNLIGDIVMPEGLNYVCGYKESRETNEGFVFVYNSLGNHFIYSISGKDGSSQVIYQNSLLNFVYDPSRFINSTRCVIRIITYTEHETGIEKIKTILIFTDGVNDQRYLCKEDSIETDFFSTSFFDPKAISPSEFQSVRAQYINLGVDKSRKCIGIEPIPSTSADKYKQNYLVDKGWQFRIKYVDVYGRESEHGHISDRFFLVTGNSCISTSSGLSRCLKLTIDAGIATVRKIVIEYRNCMLNVNDLSIDSNWVEADIIDKYNEVASAQWYNWTISTARPYNSTANTFEYTFCADRLELSIDSKDTSRLENPLPLTSESIVSLGEGIALANNRRFFDPISPEQLDRIDFTVTAPGIQECEFAPPKKIVVYAMVYFDPIFQGQSFHEKNGRVWLDQTTNRYYFHRVDRGSASFGEKGQIFPAGTTGFLGYLRGTKYTAISTNTVMYADDYTETEFGNVDTSRPYAILQKFEFLVVPGKYIFAIASHLSSTQSDYQKTSTHVAATAMLESTLSGVYPESNWAHPNKREFLIDVCTEDFIQKNEVMVIIDLYQDNGTFFEFYTYESELARVPIENAEVGVSSAAGTGTVYINYTDHNGYFFGKNNGGGTVTFRANTRDCVNVGRQAFASYTVATTPTVEDKYRSKNIFSYLGDDAYPDSGRRLIKGRIHLCGNPLIGIPGVPVVLTGGAFSFTDNNGYYTIIAHGKYGSYVNESDIAIISQNGTCQLMACTSCSMCFVDYIILYQDCSVVPREINNGTIQARIKGAGQYGPTMGGRYGLGVAFEDWMGRISFVQALDKHFVDIPSLLDTKKFAYSTIGFQIGSAFRAPEWAKTMSFWITENLSYEDAQMWAIDKIELVDGAGNVNASVANKIRIYYESISEYSKQNNFSVNTNWQFLESNGTSVVTGDRIEFYLRPDGTWFNTLVSSLVTYDKDGKYVEIDYDGNLEGIQAGTLIRLIRTKKSIGNNLYFELCPIIPISNGVPEILIGTFNYADSYLLNRAIPIPQYNINPSDKTIIDRTVILKPYTFPFEHHSPSDFWGDNCKTLGRVNVKNAYEKQKRIGSEIALSKAQVNKSDYNGLSYFDLADAKTFSYQEWGNITGIIVENTTLLVICEQDNFIVAYNDTNVRVSDNGLVIAPSAANSFGSPQRKIGNNFGCKMRDINTIQTRNGIVAFLDTTKSKLVFHTFGDANDIAYDASCKSWIDASVTRVNQLLNLPADQYKMPYFVAGIDPKTEEYYLTRFEAYRINTGPDERDLIPIYINNLQDVSMFVSETAVYNIRKGEASILKGFVSFTPEYYGTLEGFYLDNNMLSMKQGEAWSHHNKGIGPVNRFFGQQCKKVMRLIWNNGSETVKNFLYNEVYCKEHRLVASKIITQKGQISRIMASFWDHRDTFWTAPFLCAINTANDPTIPLQTGANAIVDGDLMQGQWIDVTYIASSVDDAKYCEVSAVVVYMTESGKSAQ